MLGWDAQDGKEAEFGSPPSLRVQLLEDRAKEGGAPKRSLDKVVGTKVGQEASPRAGRHQNPSPQGPAHQSQLRFNPPKRIFTHTGLAVPEQPAVASGGRNGADTLP